MRQGDAIPPKIVFALAALVGMVMTVFAAITLVERSHSRHTVTGPTAVSLEQGGGQANSLNMRLPPIGGDGAGPSAGQPSGGAEADPLRSIDTGELYPSPGEIPSERRPGR